MSFEIHLECDVADDSELIKVGDAVVLVGNYKVAIFERNFRPVFGQVIGLEKGRSVSIQTCGLCIFNYEGPSPCVDGQRGILISTTGKGLVGGASGSDGRGINLAVDKENRKVHVLL